MSETRTTLDVSPPADSPLLVGVGDRSRIVGRALFAVGATSFLALRALVLVSG